MKTKHGALVYCLWLIAAGSLGGCASMSPGSNNGQVQSYPAPVIEAGWIRNGEPIEYDGAKWYPVDDYEILDDSEVYEIMEYRGVQVFVEKIATKPYERLYTKFDKNKFRYWEQRDD